MNWRDPVIAVTVLILAVLSQQILGILGPPASLNAVASWSMDPALHVGDLIVCTPSDPQPGDIVIYADPKGVVVHRLINDSGTVLAQGDANPFPDPPFPPEKILGRVFFIVPYLGLFRLLYNRCSLLCLDLVLLVVLICYSARKAGWVEKKSE